MIRTVPIMRYRTAEQAQYHREILENAGIPVYMSGEEEAETPATDELPDLAGSVVLSVPEDRGREASSVLEEIFDSDMGNNPSIQ